MVETARRAWRVASGLAARRRLRSLRAAALAVGVGMVGVAATACGGGDPSATGASSASGSSTSTTAPSYTIDHAREALPTATELPEGYTIQQLCLQPGDSGCARDASAAAGVSSVYTVAQNSAATELLVIQIDVAASPEEAARQLAEQREEDSRFNGAFDVPVEDGGGDSSTPGRRGQGTLDDTELDGWSGYRLSTTFVYVGRDGPQETSVTSSESSLVNGNARLLVSVELEGEVPADTVASRMDDQLGHVIGQIS